MSNKACHATPTAYTVGLVAGALNTISNDVDKEALVYPLEVDQTDGTRVEVFTRETRPQVAFDVVRAMLDAAKSNQDIKNFVDGLAVDDAHYKASAPAIKEHCFIALALCRKCEALISESSLEEALEAALEAREYAAVACYLAGIGLVRLPRILRDHQSEIGRANIQKHPHHTKKAAFTAWAGDHIQTGATPKNIHDIKRLAGFDATWGKDETIKKWWRTTPGAPALKSGASRAEK